MGINKSQVMSLEQETRLKDKYYTTQFDFDQEARKEQDKIFNIINTMRVVIETHTPQIQWQIKDKLKKDQKNMELASRVFELQNKVRQNPELVIPFLEKSLEYYDEKLLWREDFTGGWKTIEGEVAVKEAITFLKGQKPVDQLKKNIGLTYISVNHTEDIGKSGASIHKGSNGKTFQQRIQSVCSQLEGAISESMAFGQETEMQVVSSLIVDDGNADRSNRNALFNSEFKEVGIASGNHTKFKELTTFNYISEEDKCRQENYWKFLNKMNKLGDRREEEESDSSYMEEEIDKMVVVAPELEEDKNLIPYVDDEEDLEKQ